MSTLYMETTKIPPEKTAAEIQQLLAYAGASQIATSYDHGEITGLRWAMEVEAQTIPFSMPVRVEPVFRHFQKKRSPKFRERAERQDRDQSKRVAWRQLLRWVQAQLAMIETGMVQTEEVFMPYIQITPNETLYQRLAGSGFKALPAPADAEVIEMRRMKP